MTAARMQQVRKTHLTPTQATRIRYNVGLKVRESMDPVAEALMELLRKIQEVDRHAVVYPWLDADRRSREPAIDNPEVTTTLLSNIKKYVYWMPNGKLGDIRPGCKE